jgi:RHS repeat-associated protein
VQNYSYGTGSSEAHVPLADHMGNVRHYYQFRASGKTVTGQLVASYEYDAFGREVRAWGLNTPATNQPPGLPANRPWADLLPFHYSSKLRDVDSGFNYYGYRFYDPGAGRWLNRDPIGEQGGVNLYDFCQNQSIGLIDVLGAFPAGGFVGGASGVASFNVDGHGSGKWHPTSPEEKEAVLSTQKAAVEIIIPIETFRQLMNGNIIAASGDLILGRLKFLKLATKLGTRRIADSGGKCCVAVEAQIVKMPLKKGRISPLAGCAPANSGGRLVHMSGASDDILASGKLGLPSNNYAGPAANSGRSGWGLTGRTGLSPSGTYGAVPIPVAGEAAFSKVTPVGIFTLWQRASGQQYTARGIMDLSTGAFTRKGVNWNQAAIYGGDAAVTVGVIGAGGYLWNEIHK